jgi:lactoylglutathione lyase
VRSLNASVAFYSRYANLRVVDQHSDRSSTGMEVTWLSDRSASEELGFVMVLQEGAPSPNARPQLPLGPISHLGFAVASRREVDDLAAQAKRDGLLKFGPTFLNPYAGYLCIVSDPDGHMVEFSYGQALRESDTHPAARHATNSVARSQPTRN